MKISRLDESPADFHLLETTPRLQTATMLLRYGEATGESPESHGKSDQTVLVLYGSLEAEIGHERLVLRAGESLIIPAGVAHLFRNAEREAALAFTVYGPPVYPAMETGTCPSPLASHSPG